MTNLPGVILDRAGERYTPVTFGLQTRYRFLDGRIHAIFLMLINVSPRLARKERGITRIER